MRHRRAAEFFRAWGVQIAGPELGAISIILARDRAELIAKMKRAPQAHAIQIRFTAFPRAARTHASGIFTDVGGSITRVRGAVVTGLTRLRIHIAIPAGSKGAVRVAGSTFSAVIACFVDLLDTVATGSSRCAAIRWAIVSIDGVAIITGFTASNEPIATDWKLVLAAL